MDEVWAFEHSILCPVSREFAWRFWTNVANWKLDPDIESVTLDGGFEAGTRGITQSKSSGQIQWQIAEAQTGRAVLEFNAAGALAQFVWTFEDADSHTKITQRSILSGEQARELAEGVAPTMQAGILAGMRKLCDAMELAARELS